ncbi:Glyoxylate/hydroxypyruvate reductase B [Streptomyces cyaneofuscatus]
MRNSAIDFDAARRHGVVVCGTASSVTPPVELTWALLLGLARGIVPENEALRTGGRWQSTLGADLHGRTLGLLGLGKIGGRVARIGLAFGMDVLAWSQNLTKERTDEVGVRLAASRDELLAASDFVSVHLALGDRTRGLIGAAELARMRPTAYLVNTSRAAVVDTDALLAALRDGVIAGAATDVFDTEPLPADDPVRTAPGCWPPRTWAMCPAPTTRRTTGRRWRTSGRSSTDSRSAASADGRPGPAPASAATPPSRPANRGLHPADTPPLGFSS